MQEAEDQIIRPITLLAAVEALVQQGRVRQTIMMAVQVAQGVQLLSQDRLLLSEVEAEADQATIRAQEDQAAVALGEHQAQPIRAEAAAAEHITHQPSMVALAAQVLFMFATRSKEK